MTNASLVFENLVALRHELSSALDMRLRTDHDLPLELFEAMTAIIAGETSIPAIALRIGMDEPDTVAILERLSSRGLCLLDPESESIRVRGLTITGGYLLKHASVAFEEQLSEALGDAVSKSSGTMLAAILHLVLTVDDRSPEKRQSH